MVHAKCSRCTPGVHGLRQVFTVHAKCSRFTPRVHGDGFDFDGPGGTMELVFISKNIDTFQKGDRFSCSLLSTVLDIPTTRKNNRTEINTKYTISRKKLDNISF